MRHISDQKKLASFLDKKKKTKIHPLINEHWKFYYNPIISRFLLNLFFSNQG